jgi:hypothetical protein
MTPSELLERIAVTLKKQVGPAVDEEYPRSQAYFSAVVLNKLAAQIRLSEKHTQAETLDHAALVRDLKRMLDDLGSLPGLDRAYTALVADGDAGQCRFIDALYASRESLGNTGFQALLNRVRKTMRTAVDRRMEVAS